MFHVTHHSPTINTNSGLVGWDTVTDSVSRCNRRKSWSNKCKLVSLDAADTDSRNHLFSCASPSRSFLGLFARWISKINPKDLWNLSSVVPRLGLDSKLRFRTHKQFALTSRKWLAAIFPLLQTCCPPEVFPFATCYARLHVVSYQSKQRDVPRHVARPACDYISQRFPVQLSVANGNSVIDFEGAICFSFCHYITAASWNCTQEALNLCATFRCKKHTRNVAFKCL